MLSSLEIEKCGILQRKEFSLGALTLFVGDNESGKTTLFDALSSSLCRLEKRGARKRRMDNRYGKDQWKARVVKEGDGDYEPLDEETFFSLFAVPRGEMILAGSTSAPWMNQIQSRLFSGGIDPELITAKMEFLCTDDGRKASFKEWERAKSETEAAEEEWQGLKALVLQGDRLEEERRQTDEEIQKKRKKFDDVTQMIRQLEKRSEMSRRWQSFRRLKGIREILLRWEGLERMGAQVHELSEAEWKDIQSRENQRQQLSREREEGQAQLRYIQEKEAEATARINEAESQFHPSFPSLVEEWKGVVEERQRREARKGTILSLALAASLALAGGGLTGFLLGSWTVAAAAAGLVILLGGAAAGVLHKSIGSRGNPKLLAFALSEWKQRFAEDPVLAVSEWAQLSGALDRLLEDHRRQGEALEGLKSNREALREEARQIQGRLHIKEEEEKSLLRAEQQFWHDRGFGSRREAEERLTALQRQHQENRQMLSQLRQEAEGEGRAAEVDVSGGKIASLLKDDWLRQYQELKGELEAEVEISLAEEKRINRELENLQAEAAELDSRLRRLTEETARLQGESAARGGNQLAERYFRSEKRLQESRENLDRIHRQRRAAQRNLRIFQEIGAQSKNNFEELARELSRAYGVITGEGKTVHVDNLDLNQSLITDAQGVPRPPENLSEGTRDAFFLGCRLLLAEGSEEESPLLWDDPFLTLDAGRRRAALKGLHLFHERTGRQIILLTKDKSVAREVEALWQRGLVVHTL